MLSILRVYFLNSILLSSLQLLKYFNIKSNFVLIIKFNEIKQRFKDLP